MTCNWKICQIKMQQIFYITKLRCNKTVFYSNALQYHYLMAISCHLQDCKTLLFSSLTRVLCYSDCADLPSTAVTALESCTGRNFSARPDPAKFRPVPARPDNFVPARPWPSKFKPGPARLKSNNTICYNNSCLSRLVCGERCRTVWKE